ncbi:hypothetical protein HZY86_02765 [Aerococcaceae bacterium DSM 111020]|nr:hypothetical protein [Aerococcaceae bacterium DSM 111020]
MKEAFKRNIFILLMIGIVLILTEIFFNITYAGLFGVGTIFIVLSLFISVNILAKLMALIGLILIGMAIFMTYSIWLFLLFLLVFFIFFRTTVGFEFGHINEQAVHPRRSSYPGSYQAIQLVEPQSSQRSLLKQTSITHQDTTHLSEFETTDVNLVYFWGNNIIDLGNTMIPDQETVIIIRKLYGRTRIIVPVEVGLSLNVSAVSGSVYFEQEHYSLTGENFQWRTPNYHETPRRLRFVISVVVGNVEVIVL